MASCMTRALLDVIIIGAGPAGAAVAARLRQHDVRDILIVERYALPRDKPCGGGLTGPVEEALARLDLKLDVAQVPSSQARVRFGTVERTVMLHRPVRMIRRVEFDQSLIEQVQRRDVEVCTGDAVKALAVEQDAVRLTLASGKQLRARMVIGADGVASIVRRHLHKGKHDTPHRLYMQELDVSRTDNAMIYDFSPMMDGLRGYLWVFPVHGNRVNVGLMQYPSIRRDGAQLIRALRAGVEHHGLTLPERGTKGWPIWAYHPGSPVAAARLLTAGDAAGVDALTGEGISVALEQGILAGDHAARGLESNDLTFKSYRRTLRQADVGRELARETLFARLLYQSGENWQRWLSLLLFDQDALELYAGKVSGSALLSYQTSRLLRALGRHVLHIGARRRQLEVAMCAHLGC